MKYLIVFIIALSSCSNTLGTAEYHDSRLKVGDTVYIEYLYQIQPAIVVKNDSKRSVVEYRLRGYYDPNLWFRYGDNHIVRGRTPENEKNF